MLSAITFGPNRALVDYLNELVGQIGDLFVYKTLHSYPGPHELMQLLNVFTPEVVFLELGSPELALELVREIRSCYPKTAIIGFCSRLEPESAAQAKQAGVNEVAAVPCPQEDLQKVILAAIQGQGATVSDNVIALMPSKAGSGATTVTLHAAAAMGKLGRSVLVIEADLHCGTIAALLDLDPRNCVLDALESSQWLSDSMWQRLVIDVSGFDLLPMPVIKRVEKHSRWEYQRLLTFARSQYDQVLVDLPEILDESAGGVLTQASSVYLVVSPERTSILLANRRIDELVSLGAAEDRIRLLLNRCGQKQAAEAERRLGRPVWAVLPSDDPHWHLGPSTIWFGDPQSELARAVRPLAHSLSRAESVPVRPPFEPRTGLRSLFRL
jgi:pilus assembly protein CpaE